MSWLTSFDAAWRPKGLQRSLRSSQHLTALRCPGRNDPQVRWRPGLLQIAVGADAIVFAGGLSGAVTCGGCTPLLFNSTSRNGTVQANSYYLQLSRGGSIAVALLAVVVGVGLTVLWNRTRSSQAARL